MRRAERQSELLEQAEPWDLVIVDEAHHARRKAPGQPGEGGPNALLRLLRGLELPFRVVRVCLGDMGAPAYKKFDTETWFPSFGAYRETHSNSNLTDYQARRFKIRPRADEFPVDNQPQYRARDAPSYRVPARLVQISGRDKMSVADYPTYASSDDC